jgi:hypothetical protein
LRRSIREVLRGVAGWQQFDSSSCSVPCWTYTSKWRLQRVGVACRGSRGMSAGDAQASGLATYTRSAPHSLGSAARGPPPAWPQRRCPTRLTGPFVTRMRVLIRHDAGCCSCSVGARVQCAIWHGTRHGASLQLAFVRRNARPPILWTAWLGQRSRTTADPALPPWVAHGWNLARHTGQPAHLRPRRCPTILAGSRSCSSNRNQRTGRTNRSERPFTDQP